MAQRRMFSLKVVDTDDFIDMSQGSRLLYYDLAMRADDDGFVSNPKKIMRMTNSSNDDIKVLVAKKFVIPFEKGVCVIRHWKIHNYIQKDRYEETIYKEEKAQLSDENGMYTKCIQNASKMYPQDRIELGKSKDSINNMQTKSAEEKQPNQINQLIEKFKPINPSYKRLYPNKSQRSALERMIKEHGFEKLSGLIEVLPEILIKDYAPRITTPITLENKLGDLMLFIGNNKPKEIRKA